MSKPSSKADKFFEFVTGWPRTFLALSLISIIALAAFVPQI